MVSNDAIKSICQLMEHKVKVMEFETYLEVGQVSRLLIKCVVHPEWLENSWIYPQDSQIDA